MLHTRIIDSLTARKQNWQTAHFERTKYGKKLKKLENSHTGERCFVVGNGPSLTVADLELIARNNIDTFATNRIFKLFNQTNWRPTYYVSEDILLMQDAQEIIHDMDVTKRFIPINLKWYEGVEIDNADWYLEEYNDPMESTFGLSTDISKKIKCRGTVTTSCLQIALYMGYSEIYLIGVDHNFAKMFDKNGNVVVDETIKNHFSEDYDKGIVDQGFQVDSATEGYLDADRLSRKKGNSRIFNATRGGKLEVFERVDIDKLLL